MFGGHKIGKQYGKKQILHDVSFLQDGNKIIALFGLNGKGKTTLFRILSGLDGNFTGDVYKKDFEDVAYMSVDTIYPAHMRIKDIIQFHATFTPALNIAAIERDLRLAGIDLRSILPTLSSGMRQYFKFLLTIYSSASVCLFDEPFVHLDIEWRERMTQTMIREIREDRLFIIATHEIKEMETLIDGFYILSNSGLSDYYDVEETVAATGQSIQAFYKENVHE